MTTPRLPEYGCLKPTELALLHVIKDMAEYNLDLDRETQMGLAGIAADHSYYKARNRLKELGFITLRPKPRNRPLDEGERTRVSEPSSVRPEDELKNVINILDALVPGQVLTKEYIHLIYSLVHSCAGTKNTHTVTPTQVLSETEYPHRIESILHGSDQTVTPTQSLLPGYDPKVLSDNISPSIPNLAQQKFSRENVATILRQWNESYAGKYSLTPATAMDMLKQADGDVARVCELIASAAGRTYVTKPVGWIITVLKAKATESPAGGEGEGVPEELREPTEDELTQMREEARAARRLLEEEDTESG